MTKKVILITILTTTIIIITTTQKWILSIQFKPKSKKKSVLLRKKYIKIKSLKISKIKKFYNCKKKKNALKKI